MSKVKIAIIGLGGMAQHHLKNSIGSSDELELTAVCDVDAEKSEKSSQEYNVPGYTDHKLLLKDGVSEAVAIVTPHYFHTNIGVDAFAAGQHVLVEKPISVHKADALTLINAHKGTDLKFSTMFQMRTIPLYKKIKELIDTGELGDLYRVHWTITDWYRSQSYYDSGSWRATWKGEGGGVLLNQCPHNLDLFQWFFGMPERITGICDLGKRHDIEVEDDVTAVMEFANGCRGVFITSTGESPGSNRLEILGEKGKLVLENNELTLTRVSTPVIEHLKTTKESMKQPDNTTEKVEIPEGSGSHKLIFENFARAIRDNEELIAPGEEGLNSLELANTILYSSLKNQSISLPLDGDAYAKKLQELIDNSSK